MAALGSGAAGGPRVPNGVGVGLKPEHWATILAERPDVAFFEIHAENYMGAGGAPHANLARIRDRYPISLHGVGLSIGGIEPLDDAHLRRLRTLIERYEPGLFSEHLALSSHEGRYFNDLLPVVYDKASLVRVVEHIDQVQRRLECRMLLENPSSYFQFEASTMSEIDFVTEVARRSGCGLLLDVNNVFVSAINNGSDASAYVDAFPMDLVAEIHLGGFAIERAEMASPLLIDAHDRPVDDHVWALYERVLARRGPVPTLIEWDNDVPCWGDLYAEMQQARARIQRVAERRWSSNEPADRVAA